AVVHGRYKVEELIGEGAMGAVYKVFDTRTERHWAMKVARLTDTDAKTRFKLEARLAAKMNSRHVVRVIDRGDDEGRKFQFFVMDLLIGEDYATILKRLRVLQRRDVLFCLRQ